MITSQGSKPRQKLIKKVIKVEVKIDNVKYKLIQEAYISDSGLTYQAAAVKDGDGQEVTVFWDVVGDESDPDESNLCDWAKPYLAPGL